MTEDLEKAARQHREGQDLALKGESSLRHMQAIESQVGCLHCFPLFFCSFLFSFFLPLSLSLFIFLSLSSCDHKEMDTLMLHAYWCTHREQYYHADPCVLETRHKSDCYSTGKQHTHTQGEGMALKELAKLAVQGTILINIDSVQGTIEQVLFVLLPTRSTCFQMERRNAHVKKNFSQSAFCDLENSASNWLDSGGSI